MSKNRKLFDEAMSGIDEMRQQRGGILTPLTDETTLLDETVPVEDWLKPEAEEARTYLQLDK